MVGATLAEIADGLGMPVPAGARRTKGWSGQVIERELGAGGGQGPDFAALGIELKSVPVSSALVPLESTAVCHIDPTSIAGESWATSYVRTKLASVLFVALEIPEGARSVGERRVALVRLWHPSPDQEAALRADFELFVRDYFRKGRAADITGHLGKVLQVRPKARNARDLRDAYDPDGRPVRLGKCGFYLRPAFVGGILAATENAEAREDAGDG
ncbi:MAG: DNA mismatch repair protein MutH [Deltaproteobacteria bacterium]|nr:DNA mismatch repair protein MutH [Deltaproteobacteria bacterium]